MYRYLELINEKSNKFWEIHVVQSNFTTRYGKVGSKGVSKKKEFESEEKALKEAEKLLSQKGKKGYGESVFHIDLKKKIDRMMTILFKYQASDSEVDLDLVPLTDQDSFGLPLSYLYLVRTYGAIGYFDMHSSCYPIDLDDFDHDENEDGFDPIFQNALSFQFSAGEYCIDAYAFGVLNRYENAELDILSFSHDDAAFVSRGTFTTHILNFFFKYFRYYRIDEDQIDATFQSIEDAIDAGISPKNPKYR